MLKQVFKALIIVAANFLFISASNAQTKGPYVRIAKIVVDSAQLEAYKTELKTGIETAVLKEPGVLTMYAVFDNKFPNHITILETYASLEAYQSHIQTAHFKRYKSSTLTMVTSLELIDVTPITYAVKKK